MNHFGIDYGSKLAGTTVVCHFFEGKLFLHQSLKKKDGDVFIGNLVAKYSPDKIFLDAPLSLPLAYYQKGNDFFYRDCDRKLKAMSPMFLGGLTARAMKLKSLHPKIQFHETYPKALVHYFEDLKIHYLKKEKINPIIINQLLEILPFKLKNPIENWHQFDAVLAWQSGFRFSENQHETVGDRGEGLIIY